jgi:hypothetical protein
MNRTRCNGCDGAGAKSPAITAELLETLRSGTESGKILTYIDDIRVRANAKNAAKRVMSVLTTYDIKDVAGLNGGMPSDSLRNFLYSEVRKPMADVYQGICAIEDRIDCLNQQLTDGHSILPQGRQSALQERDELLRNLGHTTEDAIAEIKRLAARVPSVVDRWKGGKFA